MFKNLFCILAVLFCFSAFSSDKPTKPEKSDKPDKADKPDPEKDKPKGPPQIRMIDADGRVLLSRDGQPLAVAMLRRVADGEKSPGVLSGEAAKLALKDATILALKDGEEKMRQLDCAIPTGDRKDSVSVLFRAKRVSQGTRMLVRSNVYGLARTYLAPDESLPKSEELEIAVQLFKDAEGALPQVTSVNGRRAPLPPGTALLASAYACDFEGKGGFRVNLARSAPVDWTLTNLPDGEGLLLRAKLRPDPHEAGAWGSFILYLGAGADEAPPEIAQLTLTQPVVPARDFVEGYVRVYASGANPYVLSELAVVAEIACPPPPEGVVPIKRLPCFFWEAPQSARAEGEFRFRFAPPTEGIYGARLAVITATGEAHADALPLRAGSPVSKGFARLRGSSLRLDDGSLFIPAGFNLDFPDAAARPKPDDYRKQFMTVVRHSGNCVRIWLTDRGLPLEGPQAGFFNPDVLDEIDQVLLAAQARDIRVILTFESGSRLGKHSDQHPYFHELGGPLVAAPEFFRDVAAKKLFQHRLTYAAARYAAYRSVLAWELMDDLDEAWPALKNNPENVKLTSGDTDLSRRARRDVQEWVEEMALHIKGMDQYEHPVGVSTRVPLDAPWKALENVEHLDFTCAEKVMFSASDKRDADEAARVYEWAAAAREPGRGHKGFFIGTLLDKTAGNENAALLQHNILFASLASGHTVLPLLDHGMAKPESAVWPEFSAAAQFAAALSEIQRGTLKEPPRDFVNAADAPDGAHLRIAGRATRRGIVAWIQDTRSTWTERAECPELAETDVRLPALAEGEYGVYWLDTRTGAFNQSATYKAAAKQVDKPAEPVVLKAPRFRRDVVVVVTLK
jgi:hypothetical protein